MENLIYLHALKGKVYCKVKKIVEILLCRVQRQSMTFPIDPDIHGPDQWSVVF